MSALASAPMLAGFNSRNMRLTNAKFLCQNNLRLVAVENVLNVGSRQASVPVIRSIVMAVPFRCISIVFSLSSYLKMGWVYTRRIIARMAYNHSIRDWSHKKLVSIAMGANSFLSRHQKNAVSVTVLGSRPNPAIFGFVDTAFKYIFRLKHSVFAQQSVFSDRLITRAAKFPCYGFFFVAPNTSKFYSLNPVCHGFSL